MFEVIATGGDSALGGDDYDRALADWSLAQTGRQLEVAGDDKSAACWSPRAPPRRRLSEAASACLRRQLWRTASCESRCSREQFEAATAALAARTHRRRARRRCATRSSQPDDVQGVVLVGGATRMPQIRRAVASSSAATPLTNLDPDEVVALGAAMQANQLAGNRGAGDLLLLDVIPLSLGIETMGGLVERIVPRNQTIPTAMAQDFTTYKDGQTALALHVVQGERDLVADCRSLRALRAARHSADGGRRRAHPRHLHRRCRRPAAA